ncbi:hypothetical protein BCR35DRAFT_333394 [Leucosporidium creatinivorum]|uniref:RRM domain-containing protein n=1 Tax=Leucosporidium creatinivorum TaxID=106004 RepID=A0A1Y2ESP2_9BASI|nr:hypothetical protein BCR35DRAFT_333394 [Leucosporidium creatinivorum]
MSRPPPPPPPPPPPTRQQIYVKSLVPSGLDYITLPDIIDAFSRGTGDKVKDVYRPAGEGNYFFVELATREGVLAALNVRQIKNYPIHVEESAKNLDSSWFGHAQSMGGRDFTGRKPLPVWEQNRFGAKAGAGDGGWEEGGGWGRELKGPRWGGGGGGRRDSGWGGEGGGGGIARARLMIDTAVLSTTTVVVPALVPQLAPPAHISTAVVVRPPPTLALANVPPLAPPPEEQDDTPSRIRERPPPRARAEKEDTPRGRMSVETVEEELGEGDAAMGEDKREQVVVEDEEEMKGVDEAEEVVCEDSAEELEDRALREVSTLIVRNLAPSCDAERLQQFASQSGLLDVVQTGAHAYLSGEGFIEYADAQTANRALYELNGRSLEGEWIRLQR